jgi:hypothetical protein
MLIEFGIIDYKIIIPLIYQIFYQIRRLIHKDDEKALFEFFTNFCGYLFSGIVYLIIKHRMKKLNSKNIEKINIKNDNDKEDSGKELVNVVTEKQFRLVSTIKFSENQLNLEKKKIDKINSKKQYIYVLSLVLIYLFPMFLDSYTLVNNFDIGTSSSISLFVSIFSNIILSKIILGEKIYSHQIFASMIILISILIVIILFLIKAIHIESNIGVNIALITFISSFYSLFNIMEKRYYNKFVDSPYHLMYVIGLFATILILVYEIFTVIIVGIDSNLNGIFYQFYKNCERFQYLYILIFISDILTAFIWLWGIQLTVYFFTPCHFIISESISQIISFFINDTISEYSDGEQATIIIFFFIIIFATLIYNEVLIINICSLSNNTKKNINLRQLRESESILTNIDLDEPSEIGESRDSN